jgi:hypothetical protein
MSFESYSGEFFCGAWKFFSVQIGVFVSLFGPALLCMRSQRILPPQSDGFFPELFMKVVLIPFSRRFSAY